MAPPDRSPVIERILDGLRSEVPASLLPFFRYCLEHAEHLLTVEAVAQALGVRRRALEYRLSEAGLTSPGTCIAWCRLLLAVYQLEHTSDNQEQVASALGYGTAGALRKAVTRHLQVSGRSLREPGAFEHAVVRFLQALRPGPPRPKQSNRPARRPR